MDTRICIHHLTSLVDFDTALPGEEERHVHVEMEWRRRWLWLEKSGMREPAMRVALGVGGRIIAEDGESFTRSFTRRGYYCYPYKHYATICNFYFPCGSRLRTALFDRMLRARRARLFRRFGKWDVTLACSFEDAGTTLDGLLDGCRSCALCTYDSVAPGWVKGRQWCDFQMEHWLYDANKNDGGLDDGRERT